MIPIIRTKSDVDISEIKPPMITAAWIVLQIYESFGKECWITGGGEDAPGRSKMTRHKVGLALDFRTRHLSGAMINELRHQLGLRLGHAYSWKITTATGRKHLHLQYNGKGYN